ncbi:hypothetical protein KAX02_03010 [candidate division WOR-3 bacterium]|nr:hypothetical protein [candidate division WOR-3 bacterium]
MTKEIENDGIQFFGEVDLNDQGGIKSDMPAWYFDVHIENLRENIERKARGVERNLYAPDQILRVKEEIKAERVKLKEIEDSRPKLSGKALDKCGNAYESLKKQIRETMPTRKESKDGLVSPHEELNRMKSKHIKIDTEIAKACGVHVVRGKISGDEANKVYQILGKALGENTNVERLRRDGNSEAYKTMHNLTQAILGGRAVA